MSNAAGANRKGPVSERPKRARISTFFIVELGCILCSRTVGALRSATWPAPLTVLILRRGAAPMPVEDWRHLRCDNCGGTVLPSDIEQRTVRIESRIDWESDRPRRGRPRKWVTEQRGHAGGR